MQGYIVNKPLGQTFGFTVGTTVTALPSIPSSAIRAVIQVETQPIRMTFDGLTTSVTVGVGFYVGTISTLNSITVEGWDNLNRTYMRCNGSTASLINVLYEGEGQPS